MILNTYNSECSTRIQKNQGQQAIPAENGINLRVGSTGAFDFENPFPPDMKSSNGKRSRGPQQRHRGQEDFGLLEITPSTQPC
ncbi:MAG TPA: hypothetical protein DCM07_31585 [Planctomycetaceae bacterium]|nr:hypothetical protein [Gimesia sp.]HAH49305.1 hypothetical protein [Planctomycetaceae bacterium]HBL45875.1 hypothetical protein [Planctomycetaceae bacterium]